VRKKRRRRKKQDENIMVCPITSGDHNKLSQRLVEVRQCSGTTLSERMLLLSVFILPGIAEALVRQGGN